jgi:hypothetical protein
VNYSQHFQRPAVLTQRLDLEGDASTAAINLRILDRRPQSRQCNINFLWGQAAYLQNADDGHRRGYHAMQKLLELPGREGLIIAGDVINNEIVSFEHPNWKFGYDTIPELAIRNRVRLIDRAATDRVKLLGYHWAYPGVGYAERNGSAFRFVSAA